MTHRFIVKLLLFTLVSLGVVSCYRSPCDVPASLTTSGEVLEQSFTSEVGRFKVDLPPPQNAPTPEGNGTIRYRWFFINSGQFEISYTDYANDLEHTNDHHDFFDRLRDLYVNKVPGQIEIDRELLLSGHPGRYLKVRRENSFDLSRLYLVGNRLYLVSAVVPVKLECALPGTEKTLASFELVDEN